MRHFGLPEVVKLEKDKCQHCLACLLVCPVKLCNVVEPDGISVKADLCIGCGECIRACKEKGHNARSGIDDFNAFLQEVKSGVPVGVLIAPAAAVNYDEELPKMITALRKLGVKYVFDVSFGAEIAAYEYLKLVKSGAAKPLIAQPCPAVVSYIEIYHSELIPYLAPTQSPALAAATWVKSQPLYKDLKLTFLGPCFAKRREIHDPNTGGIVSYNVTYRSLDRYFQEQGISLESLEPSNFDSPEPERAVVFSRPGGLTETFLRFGVPVKKSDIPRIEGPQEVYAKYLPGLMNDIRKGKAPILVDILNCQHGCNTGPAITHNHTHFQVDSIMDCRMEKQMEKHNVSDMANPELFKEHYEWIEGANIDLSRTYSDKSANSYLREPSQEEEKYTWEQMHKLTEEERQINCSSCGYGNCQGMMKAIINGLNHVESCKYYLFKENEINLNKVEAQAKEIQKSRDEIAAWNEELEKTVLQRTMAIRNLLNNAGQGFLSFGENLLVDEEYSSECRRIFGRDIGGLKFPELIYPQDEEGRKFLESLIEEVYNQDDEDIVVDIYLPLLPREVEIDNKHIELEYRIIKDTNASAKNCMAILTDDKDSFSTKDEVTDVSGRGVGLGAVKSELQKLNGVVEVKTSIGNGTEFKFTIPIEDEQIWGIPTSEIINPLIETTTGFLSNQIELEIKSTECFAVSKLEKLLLSDVSSFITIKGAIEGFFIVSMEEAVLRAVVKKFILEELTVDEEAEYMEDVLAECTNTILGNSLKLFPGLKEVIVIDTPVSISSKDALVKYQESEISTCSIETNAGRLSISLVVPWGLEELAQ